MSIQQTNSWAAAFAAPNDGIRRGLSKLDQVSSRIAQGEVNPEDMAGLREAEALVRANIETMRSVDRMVGTLLDEKA